MIREATLSDASACAEVYAPYVRDSAISFEEQPPDAAEFERRMRRAHLWLVAMQDGEVAGYAYGSKHRDRHAYSWTAEVAIYLAEQHHGRGLGRNLYASLFDGLRDRGLCLLCAGVTLPNPASEALHRSLGFSEVGVYRRIGFKFGRWHDVRWFQLELRPPTHIPSQPPLAAALR